MEKEELLKKDIVYPADIDRFIKEKGFGNIKSKDLEELFEKCLPGTLSFIEVYNMISSIETNKKNDTNAKIMKKWTIAVGCLTIITTIATVASLVISLLSKS